MYCVKCGVKLKDGVNQCPLCHTIMYYEENGSEPQALYSDLLPDKKKNPYLAFASIISALMLMGCICTVVICLNIEHNLSWSGYVLASCLLFYVIFILPLWFGKASPLWFVCGDFVAVALFLLYICIKTTGRWFLSFALPVDVLVGIVFITGFALRKLIDKAGFFIFGGLIILSGLFCILIEMFECITFNTKMFTWSLYVVSCTFVFGMFLILCGIIRPLRESVSRKFYI